MAMGMFCLVLVARTGQNGGKCCAAAMVRRSLRPMEHRAVSLRCGDGEAQAAAQHPRGWGEEGPRWDPAMLRARLQVPGAALPQGYPLKLRKRGYCLQDPNGDGLEKERMSSR